MTTEHPTPRPPGLDDLLDYVTANLDEGIRRAGPTPEEIDARLRELLPGGQLLAFYQWIGAMAVTEALDGVRESLSNDPREPHARHYHRDDVDELLDLADPTQNDPYPAKLPPGRDSKGQT